MTSQEYSAVNRRQLLSATAATSAGLLLADSAYAAPEKAPPLRGKAEHVISIWQEQFERALSESTQGVEADSLQSG